MNPRIEELIDYVGRERRYLDAAVSAVAPERHAVRPSPHAWCIAEVVNHLALTDQRILALLERIIGEAHAAGAAPDAATDPVLPAIDVSQVLDRSRKIRNPRGDPSPDASVATGMANLDAVHGRLRELLRRSDLPDLGSISAPHPAFGPLSGYHWVAFIAAHTHRHADQIHEIAAQLAGPEATA
jgi:hypothetical protein